MKYLIAAISVALCSATVARSQETPCAPREVIKRNLQEKYGEAILVQAMSGRGQLMEIYHSSESHTYTIVLTSPDGTSCMVDAGGNFMVVAGAPGEVS